MQTSSDDMHDSSEDLSRWGRLADALLVCQGGIERWYADADVEALHCQAQHRNLTIVAAASGTAAVIMGVLLFTEIGRGVASMSLLEGVVELIAISAVVAGIWSKRQPGWFIARHKAERYRFLKFRFLIDPALWTGVRQQRVERIHRLPSEIEEIQRLELPELKAWAEKGMLPEVPVRSAVSSAAPNDLRELIDFYLRKRLCNQLNWFNKRAEELSYRDQLLKSFPPLLFFGSVFATLVCFAYDELVSLAGAPAQISLLETNIDLLLGLSLFAAIIAVLGGGFRTLRSAYQFARNSSRYTAALEGLKPSYDALKAELQNLDATTETVAEANASLIFYHLWRGEEILEAEHREWLRLMMEAGWYG